MKKLTNQQFADCKMQIDFQFHFQIWNFTFQNIDLDCLFND